LEKTTREEDTLDWSQSKVFLVDIWDVGSEGDHLYRSRQSLWQGYTLSTYIQTYIQKLQHRCHWL